MKYLSVTETAKKWGLSERSVRNYCAMGKIEGAFLTGKTWNIPCDAQKPQRVQKSAPLTLLDVLKAEMNARLSGGIYHAVQIEFTYNSNHIEGSKLTHEQTRYIFETNTIGLEGAVNVDDIVETVNHFKCIDLVIENAKGKLSEEFIKKLHLTLKSGTKDARTPFFSVGDYKKLPNTVGDMRTASPDEVKEKMQELLENYNKTREKSFDDLLNFHYRFECIHPFQDGNGRIGRLLLFKECLKYDIVPFIIDEELKFFYYRGLREWKNERGYLRDTCLAAQDKFKALLKYFHYFC